MDDDDTVHIDEDNEKESGYKESKQSPPDIWNMRSSGHENAEISTENCTYLYLPKEKYRNMDLEVINKGNY